MAHRAGKKTARINKGSRSKRLGVKLYSGQKAEPGNIIVRQRGTSFVAGKNTKRGKDDTIFATKAGKVKFNSKNKKKFDGTKSKRKIVSVIPE